MTKGLTPKQLEVLRFIQSFIRQHQYSPSYREIMDHFSFDSLGSVYKYIKSLKNKGVLENTKHGHRSLRPIQEETTSAISSTQDLEVPLMGNFSSGYPLELFATPQMIRLSTTLISSPENTYLLQVQGDGLLEDCIHHGDLLLIEARQEIHAEEIILGRINQNNTILKRYFPEGNYIRLENLHNQEGSYTIREEHISVQGVLIALMRIF